MPVKSDTSLRSLGITRIAVTKDTRATGGVCVSLPDNFLRTAVKREAK